MDARVAVLEAGQDTILWRIDSDRIQRDREHRENKELLGSIASDVKVIAGQQQDIAAQQKTTDGNVADLLEWRKGLISEVRGALKLPKMILLATPLGSLLFGAWVFIVNHPK